MNFHKICDFDKDKWIRTKIIYQMFKNMDTQKEKFNPSAPFEKEIVNKTEHLFDK